MNLQILNEPPASVHVLTDAPKKKTFKRSVEAALGKTAVTKGSRLEQGKRAIVYWMGSIANLSSTQTSNAIIAVRTGKHAPITVLADAFLGEQFEARISNEVWTVCGTATFEPSKRGGFWYKLEIDLTTLWTYL